MVCLKEKEKEIEMEMEMEMEMEEEREKASWKRESRGKNQIRPKFRTD